MDDTDTITPDNTAIPRTVGTAGRRLRWLRVMLLGGLVGLVAAFGVLWATRQTLPALTAARLAEAEQRWQTSGLRDYEIEIEVRGAQPAVYIVQVSGGEATSATRNKIPLRQRRTWETWTVLGMFDTLASDVHSLAERSNLVVRCAFDLQNGLPARYERIEMGTGQQVSWKVKRFEPAD